MITLIILNLQWPKSNRQVTLKSFSPPTAGKHQPSGKEQTEALINYKGIYFEDENDKKYTCPKTGAHFEFNDMSRRLKKVQARRSQIEVQIAALQTQMNMEAEMAKSKESLLSEPQIPRKMSQGLSAERTDRGKNQSAVKSNNNNNNMSILTKQQRQ